jgi:cobalt/nickel transport system permease protein
LRTSAGGFFFLVNNEKEAIFMHMADALVSPAVGGAMIAVSGACLAASIWRAQKNDRLGDQKIPVMGVMSAFVFAAQMINFTIPGTGSSGHIGGGILLAALLGGGPALISIAAVLIIQCLLFADGGLLALGCNVFNMGVLPCLVAYPLVFKPILRRGLTKKRIALASIPAVVVGLQLGAFSVVIETLASGITKLPFGAFLFLMQPIHLVIGLVEGLITSAVLIYVHAARPALLDVARAEAGARPKTFYKKVLAVLGVLTILVGGGLSLFASSYPDGLEWSVGKTLAAGESVEEGAAGGAHDAAARVQDATAVMPDYAFKDSDSPAGTSFAGVAGSLVTLVLAVGAGAVIARVRRKSAK